MSDVVVCVENLAKKYVLGQQQKSARSLRDAITDTARRLTTKRLSQKKVAPVPVEEFWALKDVSFEIKQGERVGIIGRNGAGKSTLLKILSRITEPTKGRISIRGRVASLLEVGTGFHPELTGRENIFLNGSILGMSKQEIQRKFDEIVAFSEVERFLDTPVKRYSSGMYVRLAFAVAAHLEPEILIVDEVLAVGDAQFQKKCLGKMEDVGKEGRTVLFVSHQMASVTALCNQVIWLANGEVKRQGPAAEVISDYLIFGAVTSGEAILSKPTESKPFWFKRLSVFNSDYQVSASLDVRKPIPLEIEYCLERPIRNLEISFQVVNSYGILVFTSHRSLALPFDVPVGNHILQVEIPPYFLVPGSYNINLGAHIPNVELIAKHLSLATIEIEETGSQLSAYRREDQGVVLVNLGWQEASRTSTMQEISQAGTSQQQILEEA